MSESDLAIVAALVVVWGAMSARLARLDVTAPIVFVIAGLALTHGPLAGRYAARLARAAAGPAHDERPELPVRNLTRHKRG